MKMPHEKGILTSHSLYFNTEYKLFLHCLIQHTNSAICLRYIYHTGVSVSCRVHAQTDRLYSSNSKCKLYHIKAQKQITDKCKASV